MKAIFISAVYTVLMTSSLHAIDEKKLVDMTYPFSAETLHWPTAKPFQL